MVGLSRELRLLEEGARTATGYKFDARERMATTE
jgi:hypothetical protein